MTHDVLIIGAGPAGLAAAYELIRTGLRPRVIDQASTVAASWRCRHDQLHLNTHRCLSHQPGMRIPKRLGPFPSRDDYVAYLEEYAAPLAEWIDFGVRADRIDRPDDGAWAISTDQGVMRAHDVIVATGSDRLSRMPDWPGCDRYRGTLIHAGEFRHACDYVGKRVLLVGAGNSGVDIGNHLSAVDIGPSWVSIRNGPTIAPQYMLSLPTQPIVASLRWLPVKAQDALIAAVSRLILGDLSRLGIPPPPKGAVTRQIEDGVTLGVDNGFVNALKAGRFTVVPEIESFEHRSVHFRDGTTVEPDAVICATGYRLGLEGLVGHLGVLDAGGRPRFVANQCSPAHPGLWFLGQNSSLYGNMNIRRAEARRLARAIGRRTVSASTPWKSRFRPRGVSRARQGVESPCAEPARGTRRQRSVERRSLNQSPSG